MSKIIEIGKKNIDLSKIYKKTDDQDDKDNKEPEEENNTTSDYLDEFMNMQKDQFIQPQIILTPEEIRIKRSKIIKIQRYIQNFNRDLKDFENINIADKSNEELDNIIQDIQLIIGNKNANNMIALGFTQGLGMLESAAPYLNMDLTGLSMIALKDEAIRDCIKELSIELMGDLKYVKPHIRLGLLTGALCFQLNNINKTNSIINNYIDKSINDDIKIKYNDL